jgi:hypothetical protein
MIASVAGLATPTNSPDIVLDDSSQHADSPDLATVISVETQCIELD